MHTLPKQGMGKKIGEILFADVRKLDSTQSASILNCTRSRQIALIEDQGLTAAP
jgi:hypothetical protein